jgi:hypothetical protein
MAKSGGFYERWEDVPETQRNSIVLSMFPPTEKEAEVMHLDRALRIFPHLQDSGGFFVAILTKKSPLSHTEAKCTAKYVNRYRLFFIKLIFIIQNVRRDRFCWT